MTLEGLFTQNAVILWCKLDTVENLEPELSRNDLEVPGSNPPPGHYWKDLCLVVPVSRQLGFLTSFCRIIIFVCLFQCLQLVQQF